jgi:uncharacterized membrane protein
MMSHSVLMGSLSYNEMIFFSAIRGVIIILIFSLVLGSDRRLSDMLVSKVPIQRYYGTSDIV